MKMLAPLLMILAMLAAVPVFSEEPAQNLPAAAEAVQDVPDAVVFPARLGDVNFSHVDHTRWVPDCTTCHHMETYDKCSSCHGVMADARKKTDAFHMQCKGCHQEHNLSTNCTDCHIR
ncbi:cytochrome c3 family protein [Geoalkalibacter sp.]|uniref:cytochrome c3 family protein n=1 Tax=Geoalkalibacter sp. TaxID=3041440 RepID=UPI00272E7D8D|nr:cytochrome c3 family protein [Geoalkalibacter sp.]